MPLSKDRVEGQRALAAAAHPGKDHQLIAGDRDVDVFEVVLTGTPHPDHILQGAAVEGLKRSLLVHAFGEGAGHPGGSKRGGV